MAVTHKFTCDKCKKKIRNHKNYHEYTVIPENIFDFGMIHRLKIGLCNDCKNEFLINIVNLFILDKDLQEKTKKLMELEE